METVIHVLRGPIPMYHQRFHFHRLRNLLQRSLLDKRKSRAGPRGDRGRQALVDEYAMACIASAGMCPWISALDVPWDVPWGDLVECTKNGPGNSVGST